MSLLILGLLLFLGTHSVRIVADDWRSGVIARSRFCVRVADSGRMSDNPLGRYRGPSRAAPYPLSRMALLRVVYDMLGASRRNYADVRMKLASALLAETRGHRR